MPLAANHSRSRNVLEQEDLMGQMCAGSSGICWWRSEWEIRVVLETTAKRWLRLDRCTVARQRPSV